MKKTEQYVPITLHVRVGDVIISNLGIIQKSTTTNNTYLVKKLKVKGTNLFEILSDKQEIDVVEVHNGNKRNNIQKRKTKG